VKYELLWTGPALEDLRSIRDYIAAEGRPRAARRLAEKIRQRVLDLETHPSVGREVPEFTGAGYRELVVTPYRIVNELSEESDVILRIWHGRRDLGRLERPED